MTTIGSIGIGLFILIVVWILALIIFVVGVKFQSNFAGIALGTAATITFIFLVIPTEKRFEPVVEETEEKDYLIVYKNILLTTLILSALFGFIAFFFLHCIEPIRAKPIKSFYVE